MARTDEREKMLASVVSGVLAFRGRSPESLSRSYRPDQPPLSASTIRRIADGTYGRLGQRDGQIKLLRLDGMMNLPMGTLSYVYDGNVAAIRKLDFKAEEEDIRQAIVSFMTPPRKTPTSATPRKRAV